VSSSETTTGSHHIMQKAFSKVNTEAVEVFVSKIQEVIFDQLSHFINLQVETDPLDWNIFLRERSSKQIKTWINELTKDKMFDSSEFEAKSINYADPLLQQVKNLAAKKEFIKLFKMYDPNYVTKLLRMIEIITCVSVTKTELQE
jgi:hypothetical protein